MKIIETERLILRTWKEEDTEEYYQINQDPKVIEFLLGSLTKEEVKAFIISANQQFEKVGYTLFAAEEKSSGYATEGARAVLKYGFDTKGLKEIVSFTVPMNIRSRAVMEKIGMARDLKGDFVHPKLAKIINYLFMYYIKLENLKLSSFTNRTARLYGSFCITI